MKRKVLRIVQSPMNPQRWCLELDCGHEEWVTAKARPKRTYTNCNHQQCQGSR